MELIQYEYVSSRGARFKVLEDSNQDGIADGSSDSASTPHARFAGLPTSGEDVVEVVVHSDGQFRVDAVDGSTVETLATFTGMSGIQQEVTLNRVLQANEKIRIFDVLAGKSLKREQAISSTETLASRVQSTSEVPELGGTLTFLGQALTGQEEVDVIVASDTSDDWTTCTVTASTTQSLTIDIPELGYVGMKKLIFRVTTSGGRIRHFFLRVKG